MYANPFLQALAKKRRLGLFVSSSSQSNRFWPYAERLKLGRRERIGVSGKNPALHCSSSGVVMSMGVSKNTKSSLICSRVSHEYIGRY
jgi:hypothetical protein